MKKHFCIAAILMMVSADMTWAAPAPLPSWNDGPAKQAIIDFVQITTDPKSPRFVPPARRIATFDNDGTLWVEQPIYTQLAFAFDRIAALTLKHPEWKKEQLLKTIKDLSRVNVEKVLARTHSGITVEEYQEIATDWLSTAKHPRFNRPYPELIYQPMLEVLCYLRANGYRTYIVTGGGQEFVRAFADKVYGVPPEQVIGSAGKVQYAYGPDGKPILRKLPEVLLINDKAGKPENIHLFIGRRPVAAFGNSTGDRQMLEWTQAGEGTRLTMLVHHDDAAREYAYGPNSKIGAFPESLMAKAKQRGWIVISMKNDWKQMFACQNSLMEGKSNETTEMHKISQDAGGHGGGHRPRRRSIARRGSGGPQASTEKR